MKLIEQEIRYSASDLSNFLACRHLTRLELAAAHNLVEKPHRNDLGFDALVARGVQHEQRVLDEFRESGWTVAEIPNPFEEPKEAVAETEEALLSDVDVIYQAALVHKDRRGYPDFLIRAELLGGAKGYEVVDAKLARSAKARAVLQASFYSRLLAEKTGIPPRRMHLALGNGELVPFDVADYAAYERQVDRLLREVSAEGSVYPIELPYPDPVEHCAICRWLPLCRDRRRTDDDLSLIAGITANQRKALKAIDVKTRRAFAALDELPELPRLGRASLKKIHNQARIQVEGEDAGEPRWDLIDPERENGELVPDRGLLALPQPAEGDLFFDIEGARYYSEDGKEFGLQYLFGVVNGADAGENGTPVYRAFWAFDRVGERRAFEELMDFFSEHLVRYPTAHIYHYNHYEPTAVEHLSELYSTREDVLRRLMGRFATREDAVDDLLRSRVFVDLYRVVRQGILASVESYSIKRLEPFFEYERQVELEEVNKRIVEFDLAIDEATAEGDESTRAIVQGYNEDDCRATLALRDWLEGRREDLARRLGTELPRPLPPEPIEDKTPPEVKELREALRADLPKEEAAWTDYQQAQALVAELLEYHRREANPRWWRYYYLKGLSNEELIDERDAIGGLKHLKELGPEKRSVLSLYSFPPQEHSFEEGKPAEDPLKGTNFRVWEVDDGNGTITLKRGPAAPHPSALIKPSVGPPTDKHRESLRELARAVLNTGGAEWEHNAAFDLVLRRRPNADGKVAGALVGDKVDGVTAACRLAIGLDRSCLAIQGPPGTGKTYTGASQVVELIGTGKKVGVTAMSHAVVAHFLDEVAKVAGERGVPVRIGQKPGEDEHSISGSVTSNELLFKGNQTALAALQKGEVDVVGGTSWLWTRAEFENAVDVLVVDEAGQMSLADVLAASRAGRSLILLGDPQQLAHPSQAVQPPIVPSSALEHVLDGAATMPDDRGLFIERTRRMHPSITSFTSEVFYDNRLTGLPALVHQAVLSVGTWSGSGLRVADVSHEGNANSSPEEAAKVAEIARGLLGDRWRNKEEAVAKLRPQDILVVTPFNAQVHEINKTLVAAGITGVKVGTVDRFQGQEAPVVIYSTASSSAEGAPRGVAFLYNLNRLNVATSRAQCLAILVSNPDLVRVFARTPHQMELANALCRLRELES